ncbi:MAG TPA: GNAT family N-acetyltransferase [Thermoanaerobaculia bacterium]|jgi:GNAT superfamily N-acetyltransferase|nr:GNAT family N-acetyltransferase [Thermoanaerobaculia bacterium]
MDYPYSDAALSRRLERCEAKTNAAMVSARAVLHPESGATYIERAGAYAMFDAAGSPLTQTFCLGLFEPPTDEDMDALEEFFVTRGAPVFHEVSPLAHPETLVLLSRRGYRPVELSSILYRPMVTVPPTTEIRTRIIEPGEEDLWSATTAAGWSEYAELFEFMHDLGRVTTMSRGTHPFVAELEGRAVATGALAMHDGVALLAGASTIPSERKRGAQRALLEARLQYAYEHGCDLATMGALPGSASQRNAERQGFRIAYTRIKWGKM